MKRIAFVTLALASLVAASQAVTYTYTKNQFHTNGFFSGTLDLPAMATNTTGAYGTTGTSLVLKPAKTGAITEDIDVSITPGYKITSVDFSFSGTLSFVGVASNKKVSTVSLDGGNVYTYQNAIPMNVGSATPKTVALNSLDGANQMFSVTSSALIDPAAILTNGKITATYALNSSIGATLTVTSVSVVVHSTPVPVPEPASMAALAIGGLGLLRRRRKA